MQFRRSMGVRFGSQRVAETYLFRPAYSKEVYKTLLGLLRDQPRALLDAGCGPGKITFGLVDHVDRVDAIDPSEEMLRVARSFPNSRDPKIRWACARAEDAELHPPYGLIVAGASIHWMDLDRVLPKFGRALSPGAFLAVLDGDAPIAPPREAEQTHFMLDFLERREGRRPQWWANAAERMGLPILTHPAFERTGSRVTQPIEVSQSIDDFLRCEHSRATWSEAVLGEGDTREFDAQMTRILTPHTVSGVLTYAMQTRIEWGIIR
jgi:SAM-dependent methyltransferase